MGGPGTGMRGLHYVWLLSVSGDPSECGRLCGGLRVRSVCFVQMTWSSVVHRLTGQSILCRIFLSLGELGPGNNIGLLAAKSSATSIRGQYYGIAAAMGKVGAFVGTYVLPIVQKNAPNEIRAGQDPFFVSSSLCIFSAVLVWLLMPYIGQVSIIIDICTTKFSFGICRFAG